MKSVLSLCLQIGCFCFLVKSGLSLKQLKNCTEHDFIFLIRPIFFYNLMKIDKPISFLISSLLKAMYSFRSV